jgi:hypothetical protein
MVRITATNSSTFYSGIKTDADTGSRVVSFLPAFTHSGQENKMPFPPFHCSVREVMKPSLISDATLS